LIYKFKRKSDPLRFFIIKLPEKTITTGKEEVWVQMLVSNTKLLEPRNIFIHLSKQ
jgi:hypothetical protein